MSYLSYCLVDFYNTIVFVSIFKKKKTFETLKTFSTYNSFEWQTDRKTERQNFKKWIVKCLSPNASTYGNSIKSVFMFVEKDEKSFFLPNDSL